MPVVNLDGNEQRGCYLKRELFINPDALLKHFHPPTDSSERDRFSNRIFFSRDRANIGQNKEEVKAALLVSPEGEAFIKENRGILNLIDKGLTLLHNTEDENKPINMRAIRIDNDIEMQYLA